MNAAIWSGHAKTGMVEELAKRRHLQAVLIGVEPDRKISIIISNAGCDDPPRCCLVRRRSFVLGASM